MGQGLGCKCNKCGYSVHINFGVGFFYPNVMAETKEAMIKGEYGLRAKEFFERHPDGYVDCENVLAKCDKCKEYGQIPRLRLCDGSESEEFNHVCDKCGEKLEIIENAEEKLLEAKVACLKCNGVMSINDVICWD